MSGLREAFADLVADVPAYGDLDRAIEQAARERRRHHGVVAALAAVAAVLAVVAGVLAISRDGNGSPQPVGPSPTPTRTQSSRTWVDTPAVAREGYGWEVENPMTALQAGWFAVVAEHLDPGGGQLAPQDLGQGVGFTWPADGSAYSYPHDGTVELVTDGGVLEDGCRYLGTPPGTNGTESCRTERLGGPQGERARISRYQRLCGAFDGPAAAYATCGDYAVAVAVERRDGLVGYLVMRGRGTSDHNPLEPEAMAAAAADPRLTLPDAALAVPSNRAAASVLSDHFPSWRGDPEPAYPTDRPGVAYAGGKLGRDGFGMTVWLAGEDPVCGRSWLVHCVERHVYGASDPTTVFVGSWDEEDWADCCPRNSRAFSRRFVYVGPRHTVSVGVYRVVPQDQAGIGPELDQRVIDLLLDPRLQQPVVDPAFEG